MFNQIKDVSVTLLLTVLVIAVFTIGPFIITFGLVWLVVALIYYSVKGDI